MKLVTLFIVLVTVCLLVGCNRGHGVVHPPGVKASVHAPGPAPVKVKIK